MCIIRYSYFSNLSSIPGSVSWFAIAQNARTPACFQLEKGIFFHFSIIYWNGKLIVNKDILPRKFPVCKNIIRKDFDADISNVFKIFSASFLNVYKVSNIVLLQQPCYTSFVFTENYAALLLFKTKGIQWNKDYCFYIFFLSHGERPYTYSRISVESSGHAIAIFYSIHEVKIIL